MFFLLECFFVNLFCMLSLLLGTGAGESKVYWSIPAVSAALWSKIIEEKALYFAIAFCFGIAVFFDDALAAFAPVLIIASPEPVSGSRQNHQKAPFSVSILLVKGFLLALTFIRCNTLLFIFTLLIFFYSIAKVYYIDAEETVIRLKDSLAENQHELEKRQRRVQADASKNVEIAVLAERNRISGALHNSIGHTISAAILQINALGYISTQAEVKEQLGILQTSLEKGMTDIRDCLHNMHNDSFDLQTVLEQLIANISGLRIMLSCRAETLPALLKHDIVSIVKECVSNTVKHSGASEMGISILEQTGFYSVSVWDNGCGASTMQPVQGIGLSVVRETVERNGGIINIYTDTGFKIHIVFPKQHGGTAK